MPRSIDPDEVLAILRRIALAPTAPYHEWAALDAIRGELESGGIATKTDQFGQLHARVSAGAAKRALVFAAHTDHPAFEVIEASGKTGRARVLGGFRQRVFPPDVAVTVHDDAGTLSFAAALTKPVSDVEPLHNSTTVCRIDAEEPLAVGQYAVLDLPAADVAGDEIRMRAADDLAGCALIVSALRTLREERAPHDVHAIFTRAEETGLYGARLTAEDGLLPRDAYVVSVEASRALPGAETGRGIVVRAGGPAQHIQQRGRALPARRARAARRARHPLTARVAHRRDLRGLIVRPARLGRDGHRAAERQLSQRRRGRRICAGDRPSRRSAERDRARRRGCSRRRN